MIFEPCRPYHLSLLMAQGVQDSQAGEISHVPASYATLERLPGDAMCARDGERILICGGVIPASPWRGLLWALLSPHAAPHLITLHRATLRFFSTQPYRRLEATSPESYIPGCRWLELLGFSLEGKMQAFGPHGETHMLYGRVCRS